MLYYRISVTTAYAYDADGLRTAKAVGSKGYMYIWDGGKLVSQYSATSRNISGNNLLDNLLNGVFGSIFGASETLEFLYDESGSPYGFIQGKKSFLTTTHTTYYYVTNLQGDIIAIVDGNGTRVASYTYNAWGEVIASTDDTGTGIVDTNPLRYRGYYYDGETGLYYLQSRYYDAGTGRFISTDKQFDEGAGLLGYNLFAYCANNPVMFMDQTGESITLACIIIFGGIGLLAGGHFAAKASKARLGYVNGWWVAGGMVVGGGIGALFGWGFGAAATAIGTYLTAGSGGTLGTVIYSNWQKAEQALRSAYDGIKQTFNTPFGKRIVDSFIGNVIREAKYGYQGLSKFIQQEINKDVWILNNTSAKSIEWHFYWSQVSNSGGPSGPLLNELARRGIKVIFH